MTKLTEPFIPQDKYCPFCGECTLRFIEKCDSASEGEVKTSWTCDCKFSKGAVVYIYEFPRKERRKR